MPTVNRVLIEAVIIAIAFVVLFQIISMLNKKTIKSNMINIGITAFAFHILCELSGLNKWYVKSYRI